MWGAFFVRHHNLVKINSYESVFKKCHFNVFQASQQEASRPEWGTFSNNFISHYRTMEETENEVVSINSLHTNKHAVATCAQLYLAMTI